jgi:hypothetical protein
MWYVFVLFVFLRLVYHMMPVSLDCPFLIAPSVFSNVYLGQKQLEVKTNRRKFYVEMVTDITTQKTQNVKTHNRTTQKTKKMSNIYIHVCIF